MPEKFKPRKLYGLTMGSLTVCFSLSMFGAFAAVSNGQIVSIIGFIDMFFLALANMLFPIGPFVFIVCFSLGGITWVLFEAAGLTKMRHALMGGSLVGFTIGLIAWALERPEKFSTCLAYFAVPITIGILASFVTHRIGYANEKLYQSDEEMET